MGRFTTFLLPLISGALVFMTLAQRIGQSRADEPPAPVPAELKIEPAQPPAASDSAETENGSPAIPPELQEIIRIRRSMGDLFRGTEFAKTGCRREAAGDSNADDERVFSEALMRASRAVPPRRREAPAVLDDSVPPRRWDDAAQDLPTRELIASLRRTASQIDDRAEVLESRGQFDHAERMRLLSSRLRLEARILE